MTDSEEYVVLVNEADEALGTMGKLEAHRIGALHRAFSVFLFDGRSRLLMQRRAACKYHSAGLWTNTCCGHPRQGEDVAQAAHRRLKEEMGIDLELEPRFSFMYKAEVGKSLMEHELDHVFFGDFGERPDPDPAEVQDWSYMEVSDLESDLASHPERYTAWLHRCWPLVLEQANGRKEA